MVSMSKVKLNSYDDLFGRAEPIDADIVEIPLIELHEFKGHPFKIVDDDSMYELADSIRLHGVMVPAIVRPRTEGGYELIAGHRRKRASELAGKKTLPVHIRAYDDDEAIWTMVDSNLQREKMLLSEKARAYQMKYQALKHQGIASGGNSLDILGMAAKESGKTIQRYIWLARLSDELLDLVDKRQIPFGQGVDLSFLNSEEQIWVYQVFNVTNPKISSKISKKMKSLSQAHELTEELVKELLAIPVKKNKSLTIRQDKLEKYFPEGTEVSEMEELIYKLLDQWKEEYK